MMDRALTKLAEEYAPDLISQAIIDSLESKERRILQPGTDWRDGHIWITVPTVRTVEKMVGRGKAAEKKQVEEPSTFLLRDDGLIRYYDEESVNALGYSYPLIYHHTLPEQLPWELDDMRAFLRTRSAVAGAELHADLRELTMEYLDLADPMLYELLPLYIMGTYVFRIFDTVAYIHFNGNAASGKTQALAFLRAFGLNANGASQTSVSALFRFITSRPGLFCVDEQENFQSEEGQEIRRILLAGYKRGQSVARTERIGNDQMMPMQFPVYGPKAISSINPLEPVLASRTLVIPMRATLRRLPPFSHEDRRWNAIRHRLYRWALTTGPDVALADREWTLERQQQVVPHIRNRLWEVVRMFFAVADGIGRGDLVEPMAAFFTNYFQQARQNEANTNRIDLVTRSLATLLRTCQPGYGENFYALKEIRNIVLQHVEEDEADKIKSSTISRALKAADFRTTKNTKGGLHYQITAAQVDDILTRRNLEPFEEDLNWKNEIPTGTPLRDATLDWLDTVEQEAPN